MGYFANEKSYNRIKKEVFDARDNNQIMEKSIKKVLKESDYEGLYDFFLNIFRSDYDVIVLMSRRCLVLCRIFMIIFILNQEEIMEKKTLVISNQAVPVYRKTLKGKKVLIVDDILIHGRTINDMYFDIKSYCQTTFPEISIYMVDKELDCIQDEAKSRVEASYIVSKGEWRNLSNKIVNCIFSANMPYTSFVSSYFEYGNSNIIEQISGISDIKKLENTDKMQKECGLSSYYCYRTEEKIPIFKSLSIDAGLRLYWNEIIHKAAVIPYVFIKTMNIEKHNNICEDISDLLPERFVNLKKVLKCEIESDQAYRMRVLTCLLSNLYWLTIVKKNNLSQNYVTDMDTLEKSFGIEIAEELGSVLECGDLAEYNTLFSYTCEIEACKMKVDNNLLESLKQGLQSVGRDNIILLKSGLKDYFQMAWDADERSALKKLERSKGLTVDLFVEAGEESGCNKAQILGELVNCWDAGIATANYALDDSEMYVGCYVTSGEQGYRIIIENNSFVFAALIALSKVIRRIEGREEEYQSYCIRREQELLDAIRQKNTVKDYNYIKNLISQEKGYLSAWNQTILLNRENKQYDTEA